MKTADLGSFVDTFRLSELKITKTADLSSLWTQPKSVHKTAKVRSFSMIFSTVLENLQECQNTAKVRSFVDTWDKDDFRQPKSVHKTAKVRSFCNFELRQPKSVHKTA